MNSDGLNAAAINGTASQAAAILNAISVRAQAIASDAPRVLRIPRVLASGKAVIKNSFRSFRYRPVAISANANLVAKPSQLVGSDVFVSGEAGIVENAKVFASRLRRSDVFAAGLARITSKAEVLWGVFDEYATESATFVVRSSPRLGTVTIQPYDIQDYDIDFSEWFPFDDTVINASIFVDSDGLSVARAIEHPRVKVWVRNGEPGTRHKITVVAYTNDGRAKEVELKVRVKDY
jgi:hypothetical protein